MDACLVRDVPARAPHRAFDAATLIPWAAAAAIAVGLIWRVARYLGRFPIWGDEAMLLLNILERDYLGLTQHLDHNQVAPLLFLWLEKTALLILGPSEWSVHLFPMLMGLAGFVAFWRACRASFTPLLTGLAVGILAVSYYPVRHACEVKPYAFDLGFAAFYLWLTLGQLRTGAQAENRWLLGLAVLTPIAVFSSYPSVFVAGSVSLVLLPRMRGASWTQRGLYLLFNVALLASFIVHFGFVGHHQIDAAEAQRTREFLRNYWKDAFPPERLVDWPLWLVNVFTGNMFAYPVGAKNGGSAITFLLALLGSFTIWRGGERSLLALCWLPFAFNFVAAVLGKYPFGDSARITLHLAPFICVLMAHGLGQTLDWVPSPVWRPRLHLACYVLLGSCGLAGLARDLVHPYKTEHDRDVRLVAHEIASQVGPDEPVLLEHDRNKGVLAEFLWNLHAHGLAPRWRPDGVDAHTRSYWSVQCRHTDEGTPAAAAGWRMLSSEMRVVPPENDRMHTVYCRWTHWRRD